MKRLPPALAILLLLAMPAAAQDFGKDQRGDYAAALREWHPLAEQGDAEVQLGLGLMFANGQGVPQGDQTAAKGRDLVAKRMTPALIAEAQQLARAWLAERGN